MGDVCLVALHHRLPRPALLEVVEVVGVFVQLPCPGCCHVVDTGDDAAFVNRRRGLKTEKGAVVPRGRGHEPGDDEVEEVVAALVGDAYTAAMRGGKLALRAEVRP